MEIKIFGKSLFEIKKNKAQQFLEMSSGEKKESKYLPDFYSINSGGRSLSDILTITEVSDSSRATLVNDLAQKIDNAPPPISPEKEHLTPKGIFEMQMLNDKSFKLNVDLEYVDKQIADFKEKLTLLSSEEFDMRHGVKEITSVLMRLENRKKYEEVKDFFEEYPYTTTSRIARLVKNHSYLKLGEVAQFVADMPKEAVDVMKKYNENIKKVCDKMAVFYIIADKKDFEKTNNRRDPILLAQSPFGHFWQILGAWDKEMMFLEEL